MENFVKSYNAKEVDLYKFSMFLYNRRKLADATQQEFAKYLGTTTSNYQRYEAGKIRRIPFDFVENLERIFGVSKDTFLTRKEPFKDNIEIAKWLGTDEAKPYIEAAYQKYLEEKEKELHEKIRKATYGVK